MSATVDIRGSGNVNFAVRTNEIMRHRPWQRHTNTSEHQVWFPIKSTGNEKSLNMIYQDV